MRQLIKKILPRPLKNFLKAIKSKTIDSYQKKKLAKRMQIKHQELLAGLKGKEKIRVVFLAIHKSVWKVDTVFQRMLEDPFFEPEILVCPYTPYGEERMLEDMEQAYSYFKDKGYPVVKSLKGDGSWVKLEEIQPDIVFFTNPHNLTRKEYYEDAYLNYLSCYVPYHHEVGNYSGNIGQYNQFFHNAQWLIFVPHQNSYETFKKFCQTKAVNVLVTGYPMFESLFYNDIGNFNEISKWENSDNRIRIIWSPHHTIDSEELPYSNFLKYAESIKNLACEHKSHAVWSFKPHPILKSKLYDHPKWGRAKTDEYYLFWKNEEYAQLDEGEYFDLFQQSDAMIHDSGSFLAEYLYFKKPVLYTMAEANSLSFFNDFGEKALKSCRIANNFLDIEVFVKELIDNSGNDITKEHFDFYNKELKIFFDSSFPTDKILMKIKEEIYEV